MYLAKVYVNFRLQLYVQVQLSWAGPFLTLLVPLSWQDPSGFLYSSCMTSDPLPVTWFGLCTGNVPASRRSPVWRGGGGAWVWWHQGGSSQEGQEYIRSARLLREWRERDDQEFTLTSWPDNTTTQLLLNDDVTTRCDCRNHSVTFI